MGAFFTCIRAERIRDRCELARIALHGRRCDPSSKERVDPARASWSLAGSAYTDEPLNLLTALENSLKATGARLYGRAPIGLHLLVSVSPAWVKQTGELHDPKNPRNVQLAEQAVAWVQAALGGGEPCVVAWRYDLDERGGAVVDVVAAPTRAARLNRWCDERIVSVAGALKALHSLHRDDRTAFGALQTSWAVHAATTLDCTLRRGVRRDEDKAKYLDPARYGRLVDEARADAETEANLNLADQWAELAAGKRDLNVAEARVARLRAELLAARERVGIEAQRHVEAAMSAVALGIEAFTDGRITAVEPDAESGELLLIPNQDLDDAERYALWAALGPALPAGLTTVLEYIQAEADRARRGGTDQQIWYHSPINI
ncbi:hypothetical protein [Methylobacterium sp. CM6257]